MAGKRAHPSVRPPGAAAAGSILHPARSLASPGVELYFYAAPPPHRVRVQLCIVWKREGDLVVLRSAFAARSFVWAVVISLSILSGSGPMFECNASDRRECNGCDAASGRRGGRKREGIRHGTHAAPIVRRRDEPLGAAAAAAWSKQSRR